MQNDDFGDRMKLYEAFEASRKLIPLLPICVRIDGKTFSKWTKDFDRPYDKRMADLMIATTKFLVEEVNACVGYTQSDEISLILYSNNIESQVFFNGKTHKITSVIASMTTAFFNRAAEEFLPQDQAALAKRPLAFFDCRVWNVPTLEEAANTILWREQDSTKNSISMAAQSLFSHRQLQDKNGANMQEMLFSKGINWNDYPDFFKRGTFIQRRKVFRLFTEEEKERVPEKFWPTEPIERNEIRVITMPKFSSVINRVGVIFNGEEPKTEGQK